MQRRRSFGQSVGPALIGQAGKNPPNIVIYMGALLLRKLKQNVPVLFVFKVRLSGADYVTTLQEPGLNK
jgi:hypothetical protein